MNFIEFIIASLCSRLMVEALPTLVGRAFFCGVYTLVAYGLGHRSIVQSR